MYPIVSVVLLLVSLVLVGYPFWKAWSGEMEDDSWTNSGALMAKGTDEAVSGEKDRLMSALSEIEFDYSMKKLSYEDYRNLKNDYAHAAVAMLEAEKPGPSSKEPLFIEQIDVRAQIELEIEEDLRALDMKGISGGYQ